MFVLAIEQHPIQQSIVGHAFVILVFVFITRECCYDRSTRRVSITFFKLFF